MAVVQEKTENAFNTLCEIFEKHEYQPARLIPILQEIQEHYKYLPEDVLAYTATALNVSPAKVFGVASFYAHFNLEPQGRHVIRLCDGTACHVKGTPPILEAIREFLGLSEEKTTTSDMMFTVETVSCLGACGLAPVMIVDDEVHGQVTPEMAVEIIEAIADEEID